MSLFTKSGAPGNLTMVGWQEVEDDGAVPQAEPGGDRQGVLGKALKVIAVGGPTSGREAVDLRGSFMAGPAATTTVLLSEAHGRRVEEHLDHSTHHPRLEATHALKLWRLVDDHEVDLIAIGEERSISPLGRNSLATAALSLDQVASPGDRVTDDVEHAAGPLRSSLVSISAMVRTTAQVRGVMSSSMRVSRIRLSIWVQRGAASCFANIPSNMNVT